MAHTESQIPGAVMEQAGDRLTMAERRDSLRELWAVDWWWEGEEGEEEAHRRSHRSPTRHNERLREKEVANPKFFPSDA